MKWTILLAALFNFMDLQAQVQGPWNNPLMISFSQDGTNFLNAKVFQDSSGVPSLARTSAGDLIAAFQWFPSPMHGPHWDSVAVKFSSDNGISWSKPKAIKVVGLPVNFQRPFDPAISITDDGKYRIYFSSGPIGSGGLSGSVNTYSALSADGINYSFDADARFDHVTNPVIDPTVLKFNGLWHYVAPKGAPQDGAFHATALDGLQFTRLTDISSDNSHNWTGNLMLENSNEVRFYGSGPRIWWSSSSDGISWSSYTSTNIQGGDPAVEKLATNSYLMINVGKNQTITGIGNSPAELSVSIYPNPAREVLFIALTEETGSASLSLCNSAGQVVWVESLTNSLINRIDISTFPAGIYLGRIVTSKSVYNKLIMVLH